MSKSYKLSNNKYWSSKGIEHNHKTLADILYPVGSIYMSTASTSPATLFGGSWTQITGRFLYCTTTSKTTGGSTNTGQASGNTGSTTLKVTQIPSHSHSTYSYCTTNEASGYGLTGNEGFKNRVIVTTLSSTPATGATGGGQGHTHTLNNHTHTQNLPPWFSVYCWYRTA